MSFESDSYLPQRPNLVRSVAELLELLGYRRAGPPAFKWRDGSFGYFSLHSEQDYRSFSGVYLVLYRDKHPGLRVYTRTNSWCSWWDLDQQIRTIRLLRKHFGGSFITDVGKNRFWRNDKQPLRPAEAGCLVALQRFENSIELAIHFLGEREFHPNWSNPKRLKVLDHFNPRLFANNLLLPYLVAVMEDYFKSVFTAILKYSENKEALFKGARLPPERLVMVSKRQATIEDALAEGMSFQNLGSIHNHFKMLDRKFDVAGILRRPLGRRRTSLYSAMEATISRRHDLIHRNTIDPSLEDGDVARVVEDVDAAIRRCHEHLSEVCGWSVGSISQESGKVRKRLRCRKSGARLVSAAEI